MKGGNDVTLFSNGEPYHNHLPKVVIQTNSNDPVPTIYVNGEKAWVSTFSHMYVTSGDTFYGEDSYEASIYLESDKLSRLHSLCVSRGECVFYQ